MDKRSHDIAYFLSFCIEQYKHVKHMSGDEAMRVLDRYDVLDYLKEHYEVLHSQSRQWIMEDIDDYISIRQKEEVEL